jgi:very-short-patch-repair endonuclease
MLKSTKYVTPLFQDAAGSTFENAKFLRCNETEAEKLLWNELRNGKLHGFKFRRQHPIAKLVADFYCARKKLVIELDGSVHDNNENKEYDKLRTEFLTDFKVTVIRFKNYEVERNMEKVLSEITKVLEQL